MRTADGQPYLIQVPPVMAVPLGDGSNERNFLRVQDRMILEIVRANNWKRPIYFAVTTSRDNFVGLDRNLRMDGLAYRVMDRPQRENAVDTQVLGAKLDIMEKNLRGLDDSGVYYDDNIQKLVQNYRSAFIQQAMELDANKQRALALKTLSRMDKALPETVVPSVSPMLTMQLGLLFERLGDAKALRSRLEIQDPAKLSQEERFYLGSYWISPLGDLKRGLAVLDSLASEDASQQVRLQTAAVLESLGKENKGAMAAARARYEAVLKFQPDQPEAVGGLIRVLEAQGDYAAAIRSVEAWLKLSPNDPGALDKLARLRALAAGKPLPAATEEQAATTP
jgi:tetratricopeptide (TPR) repeat protein